MNNLPSVNALGNPLVANLRALSMGDVNGTYNPQPTAPTLVLDTVIAGFGSGTATVRFTSSGSGVFERGICWGASPNPTVSGNRFVFGGSGGYGFTQVFSGSMVGNQLHHARAYARTSLGIFYSNDKTFVSLGIGSTYAGGIIFHIDSTGRYGLVCAPYDQSQGIYHYLPWCSLGSLGQSNTSTALGTGQANTHNILSVCSERPIAASVCDNLVLNGYSDWYLPSRDELQLIYSNIHTQNMGSFSNHGGYWSSSRYNSFGSWIVEFGNGTITEWDNNNMDTHCKVRAVRSISSGNPIVLPSVTTLSATFITGTSARVGGIVTSDGGSPVFSRGVACGTGQSPTTANIFTRDSSGTGAFFSQLNGLIPSTSYHARAYATNNLGTFYGNEINFTTTQEINVGAIYSGGIVFFCRFHRSTWIGMCSLRPSRPRLLLLLQVGL